MKILNGKTAIVTGAAQGIGAAIAKRLAEEGASVLVDDVGHRIMAAERVVSEITSEGGRAVAFPADISKPSEVKAMFQEAKKQFSKVDILVNNAALFKPVPLSDFSEEDFHWHFNSNVMGGFLCARESLAYFPEEGGSIINITSILSRQPVTPFSIYNSTKERSTR